MFKNIKLICITIPISCALLGYLLVKRDVKVRDHSLTTYSYTLTKGTKYLVEFESGLVDSHEVWMIEKSLLKTISDF
tara:strand:- start:5680 stop:5910 length:231 start_codon:yes stop_codon:yes gene_type:complete